jgi:hypothetical protein
VRSNVLLRQAYVTIRTGPKNLSKSAAMGVRKSTCVDCLLTGFFETCRIKAEPYVDHPPRDLTKEGVNR